jgi:predicted Zn-dependent peptidase
MNRQSLSFVPRLAFVMLLLLGAALGGPLAAQRDDRPKQPKLGPPPVLKLAPIQHFTLSNGLGVTLVEKHEVPLVQVEVVVRTGSAMDPAGKSGLASMTAAMLEEGAGTRNALEFADAIDFLGASISAYAGQHTSGAILHTPLSKLDSSLALLSDVVLRPKFPPEELERNRKERLTTLSQWHDQPRAIASVLFSKTLYGDSHPYGIPSMGNEKSLRSMTADDLRSFHAAYFRPNNGYIVVSGDVKGAEILAKLEQLFGRWDQAPVAQPSIPKAEQVQKRQIYLADKPGAAQSEIRIGRIGVARMTEDYFPLLVMNTILGGAFTSRLNQNLREEHGYSYGAGSFFDFRPTAGPFMAYAAVQTDVTDKALVEFMKELKGILAPVPEEELARAKNNIALSYPRDFQSVAEIAGQLADLQMYGLPDDYFNNYIQKVLSVTADDVQRVAKKYLDPEKVAIIIVGDRAVVEKGLLETHIAPIQAYTIDEILGPAPVVDAGGR